MHQNTCHKSGKNPAFTSRFGGRVKYILFLWPIPYLIACSTLPEEPYQVAKVASEQQFPTAVAMIETQRGSGVAGRVDFTETPQGLQIDYRLSGLPENKKLAFQIHERGNCLSPGKTAEKLPQLRSDMNGFAMGTFLVPNFSIDKSNPVQGKSIVAQTGARNACGIIEVASK